MKQCFKCHRTLPLEEFYRHPRMADGHLGKCKDCAKRDVQVNYAANREQKAAYDRQREMTPQRRKQKLEYQRRQRQRCPEKFLARNKVNKATAAGRLIKQPCQVCGCAVAQAHHSDYSQPFLVQWLCFGCHQRTHGKTPRVPF